MERYKDVNPDAPPLPPPMRLIIEGVHPDISNEPRQRIYCDYIERYTEARKSVDIQT